MIPAASAAGEVLGQERVRQGGDDREVAGGAGLVADLAQPPRVAGGLLDGVDVADPAVVPRGAGEGDLGQAADVDRHRRRRRRVHHQPRRGVELALELRPARLPQRLHQRDAFVGALAAGGEVLAEQLELLAAPADAHAQRDPVAGQHGRGGDRLGHLERAAQRGDVDAVEEAHPGGHRRERADQHPRVRPVGVQVPAALAVRRVGVRRRQLLQVDDVVRHRDRVVAELVGRLGERDQVVGRLEGGDDGEAHPAKLPGRSRTCSSLRGR